MAKGYRYLLGDSPAEARRLRAQARLWDPVALALFDRLKIKPGWKVLEVGPGQGSLHRELRRRLRGPADAVEPAASFASRLRSFGRADGYGPGSLWQSGLLEAPLPSARYDLIFARWVFLFLPRPLDHLKRLARALKPGGRIAVMDYYRGTFGLVPTPAVWTDFLAADRDFFASQGGNASIGGELPGLYEKAGLKVEEVSAEIKTAYPGSAEWRWLTRYMFGILPRYAEFPPFSMAKAGALRRALLAAGRRRQSLLIAPAVLTVVGKKPG